MNALEKAEMVARWAHRDQTDLAGMPYWTHCARVVGNLKVEGYDDEILAIGWLHDVVEDTDVTLKDLVDLGFSVRIVLGVASMTQLKNEPLTDYWTRVRNNSDARIVKLYGDIPDNDDPQRSRRMGNEQFSLRQHAKYKRAREFLSDTKFWTGPELPLGDV